MTTLGALASCPGGSLVWTPDEARRLPADLRHHVGTLNYYRARADDYVRRHPGASPPDYYLNYGEKYAHRFHHEVRPTLTAKGQRWCDRTLLSLQQQMETARTLDPIWFGGLEEDPVAFRRYAFATHPKAYLDSGLASLALQDGLKIIRSPDLSDRLSADGLEQLATATVYLVRDTDARQFLIAARNTVKYLAHQMDAMPRSYYVTSASDRRHTLI